MFKFYKVLYLIFFILVLSSCGGGGSSSGGSTTNTINTINTADISAVIISRSAIKLIWDNVDNVTNSYNIYYATESLTALNGGYSNYATINGVLKINQTSPVTIDSLNDNTKYYFVVTAVTNSIESKASNEVFATILDIPPLNDTGITWTGNNLDCSGTNTIVQQDCSQGRDALAIGGNLNKVGAGMAGFDYTKLGQTGNDLIIQNATWSDTGTEKAGTKWSCVKDNHTGLVWEVKTNDGEAPTIEYPAHDDLYEIDTASSNNIHHKDNKYRWGGLTALGKRSYDSSEWYYDDEIETFYYDDWNSLVNGTNKIEKLCGFSDWRVPTIRELNSILHRGRHKPAIDNNYFPNTVNNLYWSSTPYNTASLAVAWNMSFDSGRPGSPYYDHDDNFRSSYYMVRLVSSGL